MDFLYHIHIMTLFPDVVGDMLCESILGRAQERDIIRIDCHQIRDYTLNKQKQVDDYPYGGGHGAVMQADPLYQCWQHLCDLEGERVHTIYLSPAGTVFRQADAKRLHQDYNNAVCRLVPGVLSDPECFTAESHWDGLLEYPQYSRPEVWHDRRVPPILLSGHHANIAKWRRKQAILHTRDRRPDMYERLDLSSKADRKLLKEIADEEAVQEDNVPLTTE